LRLIEFEGSRKANRQEDDLSSVWRVVSIVININTPREEEHLCCLSTTSRDYVNI
jgi:hypothetical protein